MKISLCISGRVGGRPIRMLLHDTFGNDRRQKDDHHALGACRLDLSRSAGLRPLACSVSLSHSARNGYQGWG